MNNNAKNNNGVYPVEDNGTGTPELPDTTKVMLNSGTGSLQSSLPNKVLLCRFDKYDIEVLVTPRNEFLDIRGVRINKDFLTYRQKMKTPILPDLDNFYKE